MAKERVKAPWLNFYDEVKPHLEYPDFSAYKLIEFTSFKHANNISYNYFGTKRTYYEFLKQIDEAARAFKNIGIGHKDIVSIIMPNTPEAIIAFYAINKIGAISNMIHPLSGENEIKDFLNKANSRCVIVIDAALEKINNIIKDTKVKDVIVVSAADSMPPYLAIAYNATNTFKDLAKALKNFITQNNKLTIRWNEFIKGGKSYTREIDDTFKGKDVAAIMYSGGTSGAPKGVELTNLNLNAMAMQSFEAVACVKEKDTVLAIMPIFHAFGLGVCIHTVQYFGGTTILVPQFSAKTFDKLLKQYQPNVLIGVPTLYEALMNNKNLKHYKLDFLKCAISGGDSLSVELKKKVDDFFESHGAHIQLREGYGLTESTGPSCLLPNKYYRMGSIGIPYPDTYYKIVEPNTDKQLPYGEEGEIVISGPTVMQGYLRSRKETKETLRKHKDGRVWLHTGDQGIMDKDGFVYFKQRIKRMIVSSGYCLYPGYMENVIDAHPDVSMSCVIGIPHPYKVQVAKAFIVLRDPKKKNEETLQSIKEHCEKNLARYSWPYKYEFRDELPKTLVGKVAYNVLEHEEEAEVAPSEFEYNDTRTQAIQIVDPELIDEMKNDKKEG